MTNVSWGYCWRRSCCYQLYSGSYGLHATSPLWHPLLESASGSWGLGRGQRWSWGAFLKGIVTVRAEDVHDHSVIRLGMVRERTPPHQSSSLDEAQCGLLGKNKHWRRTVLRMRFCLSWGRVGSLFSQGQGATLSVLSGALWLPDAVIVWSGVLWRWWRVTAPWPGNNNEHRINEMRQKSPHSPVS